ncbi:rhodanese-like domain-containing protein [Kitasatospora humi]|uniref:rhodanese-like domain-containing protein n=1 Tax=Kitasatospora humi TaxID=2893891 RepID=UPI0024C015AC|nr:rhodanese-like domain-containing protein [Kitasatospora humi]
MSTPAQWFDPELALLEERVAATELAWLTLDVDVATLRVEIDNFALIHHERLGPLYARLDELEALVAEARAARTGDPEDLRRAAEARQVVDELPDLDALFADIREAEAARSEQRPPGGPQSGEPPREDPRAGEPPREVPGAAGWGRVRPGKEAQRLYRELARAAHPDLSTDPAEQRRRSEFIARANEAYGRGDTEALRVLAEEWSTAPEAAPHPQAPERGQWLRQRLEWLGARIGELAAERVRLESSPMGALLALAPGEPERLLTELADQLLATAAERQRELERLLGEAAPAGGHARHNGPFPDFRPGGPTSAHRPPSPQETPSMFQQIPTVVVETVPAGAALIDVREQDEWDAGHAEGALHLPMSQFTARLDELPDGPLYVVCRVGGRSAQVVQYLVAQGREAFNVDGGMFAWEQAGRPLVSGSGDQAYVL